VRLYRQNGAAGGDVTVAGAVQIVVGVAVLLWHRRASQIDDANTGGTSSSRQHRSRPRRSLLWHATHSIASLQLLLRLLLRLLLLAEALLLSLSLCLSRANGPVAG
jgi:hypothetical protein